MFWASFLGGLAAGGCLLFLFNLLLPRWGAWLFNRLLHRLLVDPYHENLLEAVNVAVKVGPLNLAELELRAASGLPLPRPFGAREIGSPWGLFFFRPVYLTRRPLNLEEEVITEVVIGPRAARPLRVGIPILIGGMGWGIALSHRVKLALAKGARMVGTAANTGGGPFLPEERAAAEKLIVQINRASWLREEKFLRLADAVEVALGHGALGAAPTAVLPEDLARDPVFREALGKAKPVIEGVLPEGHGPEALKAFLAHLRKITGGVPVGIKIGATDRLEEELAVLMTAEPDFITLDGGEGGTHGVAAALHDALGLPTLYALCRAERFLRMHGVRERVSLLVGGGLIRPDDFLKAMALGADAVYIGTAALLAAAHGQIEKVLPYEPPTALVFHEGARTEAFVVEKGAEHLARYLRSVVAEMKLLAKALGRSDLRAINRDDLCCLNRDLAEFAGVRWAGLAPAPEDA